ncbi:MAG: hypothetical protein U1F36_03585 [Planctomycetota bacterium]
MIRGGSWFDSAWRCRSSYRNRRHADDRNDDLGFRPASSSHLGPIDPLAPARPGRCAK